MEELNLTKEDLDKISELQAKKDSEEHYTERPRFQRILAWTLLAVVVIGIGLYCYWLMLPQA